MGGSEHPRELGDTRATLAVILSLKPRDLLGTENLSPGVQGRVKRSGLSPTPGASCGLRCLQLS